MYWLLVTFQLIIALGLLNVWLLRSRKATPYRGGDATNMLEEFATYGLPPSVMWLTGGFKVSLAILLIAGIWIPAATQPAAALLAILMLVAVVMHLKVGDPVRKLVPAASLFALCLMVTAMTSNLTPSASQNSSLNSKRSEAVMIDREPVRSDGA